MRKMTLADVQKNEIAKKNSKQNLISKMKVVETVKDAIVNGDVSDVVKLGNVELETEKLLTKLAKIEKELNEYKNKFKSTDAERKKNAKELDKVRSVNRLLNTDIVELNSVIRIKDRELMAVSTTNDKLTTEINELKTDNEGLFIENKKLMARNSKLDALVSEFENTSHNELRKEIRVLNGKLNDSNSKLNSMLTGRENLNKKHVKLIGENKELVKNFKELKKKFNSLNREHTNLVVKVNKLEENLSTLRSKNRNVSMWSEKELRNFLRKVDYKYIRDAFVSDIQNPENKLPGSVKKRFEDDVYFDELQKVKRDMAIIHLSDKKKPGFETMTSVGVLLDFGDGNFGFKNMNTDKEHPVVDLGRFIGDAYDGAVVRVEVKKDKSVRVLMIFEENRGDQFFKHVTTKRKKLKATRTDGFGVSEKMKFRLNELIGDRDVVLVSSGISNTMREYVSKHVQNIEFIDAFEMGTTRVTSSMNRADICIIQPDKVPHSVTDIIEDKKDEKYVWAPGLNAREVVRELFMHLNK